MVRVPLCGQAGALNWCELRRGAYRATDWGGQTRMDSRMHLAFADSCTVGMVALPVDDFLLCTVCCFRTHDAKGTYVYPCGRLVPRCVPYLALVCVLYAIVMRCLFRFAVNAATLSFGRWTRI